MPTAHDLTVRLADLLRREHAFLADFLVALADFDARRVWLELGHPNLFSFLHRELGLSKGAAHYRKVAAELVRKFPELVEPLRQGKLCITSVVELAKVLTPENRADVLPRFFHRSKREAAEVVAALRPCEAPPRRAVVTPVRAASSASAPAVATVQGVSDTGPVLVSPPASSRIENMSQSVQLANHLDANSGAFGPALLSQPHEGDALDEQRVAPGERPPVGGPSAPAPSAPAPREGDLAEPLTADLRRLHVTVTRSFLEKLEAAADALGHACPEGNAADILERGLDLVLAAHAKRQGLVERPRKVQPPSRRGTIPAAVKRQVWRRAGGRCEWTFANGKRCDCRRRLEYDHIEPLARGGESTVANVRLACRGHNLLAARRVFGDSVVDRYARRRDAGAAPAASHESVAVVTSLTFPDPRSRTAARP